MGPPKKFKKYDSKAGSDRLSKPIDIDIKIYLYQEF